MTNQKEKQPLIVNYKVLGGFYISGVPYKPGDFLKSDANSGLTRNLLRRGKIIEHKGGGKRNAAQGESGEGENPPASEGATA